MDSHAAAIPGAQLWCLGEWPPYSAVARLSEWSRHWITAVCFGKTAFRVAISTIRLRLEATLGHAVLSYMGFYASGHRHPVLHAAILLHGSSHLLTRRLGRASVQQCASWSQFSWFRSPSRLCHVNQDLSFAGDFLYILPFRMSYSRELQGCETDVSIAQLSQTRTRNPDAAALPGNGVQN